MIGFPIQTPLNNELDPIQKNLDFYLAQFAKKSSKGKPYSDSHIVILKSGL